MDEERLLDRLRAATERITSGDPLPMTEVITTQTPDGPMREFRRIVMFPCGHRVEGDSTAGGCPMCGDAGDFSCDGTQRTS